MVADALCVLNPAYGQGMTVAALEALLLRRLLACGESGELAPRLFRGAARLVGTAWSLTVSADLRFPEVVGRRRAADRFVNSYLSRYQAAAAVDPALANAFICVANLVAPPSRLFAPSLVLRVLRAACGHRSASGSSILLRFPPARPGDAHVHSAGRGSPSADGLTPS